MLRVLAIVMFVAACGSAVPMPPPSEAARATGSPTAAGAPSPRGSPSTPGSPARPLFDAHVHYSEPAWSLYAPERALAALAQAGVTRAIVSSTPDEGTWKLYERAPDVVVPFLRPYRADSGSASWTRDGTVVAYVSSIYRRGLHRGIGEIHVAAGESELPVVRALIDLAVKERIWLEIHTDARGIDEIMRGPAASTTVLWAHAGQFASPAEIARLIERYPTLWVELSGRSDIASGDRLDPGWRDLLTRYADRFLAGSDTWINPQWERLAEIHAATRGWLDLLPADVAAKIATENADRLFPRR